MRRELGMAVAVAVICAFLWFSNHNFIGQYNVLDLLRSIGMLGILAIGSSLVIITGGIDLSVGAIVCLTGVLIAKLSSPSTGGLHYPLWIGISVALAVALLIGIFQGLLVTRMALQPSIVTLGGLMWIRGIAEVIINGRTISFGDSSFVNLANYGLIKVGHEAVFSWPFLGFIAAILLGGYLLHMTVYGRYLFAIGGNRDAAYYSGLPVKRVELGAYVISALTAGISGIFYASFIQDAGPTVGHGYELYAIAAAVIGGVSLRGGEGTIVGVIIGTSMMEVINNGITMFQWHYHNARGQLRTFHLGTHWQDFITGAVILLAVTFDQISYFLAKRKRLKAQAAKAS